MIAPTASVADTKALVGTVADNAVADTAVADTAVADTPATVWPLALRVAFRFSFVYFGMYVITTQMLGGFFTIPFLSFEFPDFGKIGPMGSLVTWVGHHLLNVDPVLEPTGSGDTLFDWTQAFTMLIIATTATVIWSLAAKAQPNYLRLHKWFRLFLRFALGTTMLSYGFAKFFPLQMPTIFLNRLLEPYGNFSPMGVLWYSIGAAPTYEMFIGLAEIVAGTLLFIPRTAMLGALMSLNLAMGIFMVNMTYDVPVKLFAFHLILFSIVLLAADAKRLVLFLLHRTVPAEEPAKLGGSERANRIWTRAQVVCGAWFLGCGLSIGPQNMREYGADAPKSPLFGIWTVDSMAVNGSEILPLTSDSTRYRNAVFQRPTAISFQKQDLTFLTYATAFDTVKKTIALNKMGDTTWKATLAYQRPMHEQLLLDGDFDGKRIHMRLTLRDLSKLNINRGFHWVQQQPYNR